MSKERKKREGGGTGLYIYAPLSEGGDLDRK